MSTAAFLRSPFPWFGGKHDLAPAIRDLLPSHLVYVEAFGGAASVLMAKQPSRLDVYNDLDEGLVTFFRVLRDEPDELERRLRLTPYSRAEFRLCRDSWAEQADDVERARRWYVRVEQAFAGSPVTSGWGGERLGRSHASRALTSMRRLGRLHAIANRLRSVQIEQLDWRDVLGRLDPPYVFETRRRPRSSGGRDYAHELTDDEHSDLVARVLDLDASVLISGYDHPIYHRLDEAGFTRHEFAVICTAERRQSEQRRSARVEVVWRRLNERHSHGRLWS